MKALTGALKRKAQEGVPLELLKDMEDVFRRGLISKLPALVTSMRLQ